MCYNICMTRVSYISLTTPQRESFYKNVKPNDAFFNSKIIRKTALLSRAKLQKLDSKSLLSQISALWAELDDTARDAWATSGGYMNLNGWRNFVQEQTLRIKRAISGLGSPSIYHQGKVGILEIASPANQIEIAQFHPASYYVKKKVTGTKNTYGPILVTESMSLPITITLSYSSDLTSVTGSPYAKFYANLRSSYQGIDRDNFVEINLDPSSDWQTATATISTTLGYLIGYTLYFHIFGYRGKVWFDNIKVEHSGSNWARDPHCNNINSEFTRAFYQVPKNWAPITLENGAKFYSDYIDF